VVVLDFPLMLFAVPVFWIGAKSYRRSIAGF